jgi:hypothetical protein
VTYQVEPMLECQAGQATWADSQNGRSRTPAPPLGYATWFAQRHMPAGTMFMRTVVPRTAPAVRWRQVNLRQGSQMASQLEFSARAALCRQLAKREPTNRVLWMAEAENWSRLSNEKLRGEAEQEPVTASWRVCGRAPHDCLPIST